MNLTPHQTYTTHAELKAAVDAEAANGWYALPCDDPEHAVIGYMIVRYTCNGRVVAEGTHRPSDGELVEETRWLVWKPFGDLTLDERVITKFDEVPLAEVLNTLAAKTLYKADNPKRLQLGFVYYEDGIAHLTRIPLSRVKATPEVEVAGVPFRDWRDALPTLRAVIPTE